MQVVAGIIQDETGRVLLAQRPDGKDLAGLWEFPGGKIEDGEMPDRALVRELREELNLEINIVEELGQFEYRYSWGSVYLHVFVVAARSEPQKTADVSVFRWVKPDDVDNYSLAPADLRPWFFYLDNRRQSRLSAGSK